MAQEIAYKVSVESDGAAKSLKSLKQEFKDTQKELDGLTQGSKEYVKTLQKLGNIKDEIGDLNQEIKAFNPEGKVQAFSSVIGGLASGFQAAQGAAALFGAQGEALQKTLLKVQAATAFAEGIKGIVGMGDAFKVLGNIIKANPILLIASVIIGIGTALFELKDKIPLVGKAFEYIGKFIDGFIEQLKAVGDWIGITNFKMDKMRQSIIDNNDRAKKAIIDRYDSEIEAAKRAGKATELLEIEKLNAITKYNSKTIEQLNLRKKEGQSLTDEEKKQLEELTAENQKYYIQIQDLNDADNDNRAKKYKEDTAKYKEEADKKLEAQRKLNNETAKLLDEAARIAQEVRNQEAADDLAAKQAKQETEWAMMDADTEAYLRQIDARKELDAMAAEESFAAKQAYLDKERQQIIDNTNITESERMVLLEQNAQKEKELNSQKQAQAVSTIEAGLNAASALSNLYFAGQAKKAKGNAKAELELKKKQFKVDKAFNIVRATIDGIRSVQAALTQSPPLSYVLAAFNGVMAAANIAKIASAKFEGGESGGGGGASLGSAGGGAPIAPPTTGSTLLNADGTIKAQQAQQQPTVKAIVTETDITKVRKRVNGIEETSKIK